jgi:hypothetical protein
MKLTETDSNKNTLRIDAQSTREPVKYQKVYDERKRRIRGLWKRGGAFYAQLSLPNEDGIRKVRRVKLDGAAVAAATDEMRRMVIDRNDDQLPAMVRKPKFDDYAQEYIDREYALGRKTHRTLNTESGHINFWKKQFAGTAAEPAAQVEEELLNQAKRLAKEGLTDEELRRAKAKLIGHRKNDKVLTTMIRKFIAGLLALVRRQPDHPAICSNTHRPLPPASIPSQPIRRLLI